MNNLKSYTEYAVTTPTTDFVIGFDFNYGTDAVNVTVDDVPATEAGYSVIYLNSTTMRLSPAVPSGVVRLQRETDIDVPDNQFTAGAKFIASNMDENFTQIRHAQQEVRDGFEKLSEDTYEIIDTLQDVGQAAQDAADAAEQAAQTANDAASQVNDKVSYQDLDNAIASTPHNNFIDRDVAGAHPASAISYDDGSVGGFLDRQVAINDNIIKSEYIFQPSSAPDHTQELQDAIDYCVANFLNCKPIGLFKTSGKVVIKGEFDGSRCRIQTQVYGPVVSIPIAVEVSTGMGENPTTVLSLLDSQRIILPDVVNGTKPSVGWEGQGIGVRYVNVQNTLITERLVQDFAIGIQHTAYSVGCGYNTVDAGYLRNNKINRQFKVGNATGWTNRWDFYGGRYFHSSSEGVEVAGVMHFDVVPNSTGLIINDINHWGGSFEGMVQQYHLRLGGAYISFFGIRVETAAVYGGVKVHLAGAGLVNQGAFNGIYYGRGVSGQGINITADPIVGVPSFSVKSAQGTEIFIGNGTLTSYQTKTSSIQPALNFFDANAPFDVNRDTEWSLGIAAHKIMGKRRADTVSRIEFDTQNGRLYFGNGASALTKYFADRSDGIGSGSHFYPNSNDTYDNGNSTLKWRGVYSTKYMFTATVGAFYGAGSPDGVVNAGVGSTYHRTDGTAGQCFYVKESGTGDTGWVAK